MQRLPWVRYACLSVMVSSDDKTSLLRISLFMPITWTLHPLESVERIHGTSAKSGTISRSDEYSKHGDQAEITSGGTGSRQSVTPNPVSEPRGRHYSQAFAGIYLVYCSLELRMVVDWSLRHPRTAVASGLLPRRRSASRLLPGIWDTLGIAGGVLIARWSTYQLRHMSHR